MKIDFKTKFFYGMGFISVGIKDILYAVFVFFYFSQILGLDQIYTGTATLIALLFDAVSDPIIGTISDNYKSKKIRQKTSIYGNIGHSSWTLNISFIYTF